jgi:hypothetical protein|eukprot:scaffold12353_cov256-Chaetoceros_neogracile.AAC.1
MKEESDIASQPLPSTSNGTIGSKSYYSDDPEISSPGQSSLLVCSCDAAVAEREMISLQKIATETLSSTYQDINRSEMQLDGQVKEIHELVEELLNVEKEEREILSRIQDIELRTRRSGVIGHRVDEEFSSEIKQRDAKIQELENELLHNTNLLRQL